MKTKKLTFILTSAILFLAAALFAVCTQTPYFVFRAASLEVISFFLFFIAIISCLLVSLREYLSVKTVFKALLTVFGFCFVDFLGVYFSFFMSVSFGYTVLKPILLVFFIWLAYCWITKQIIKPKKWFYISGGIAAFLHILISFLAYALSLCYSYVPLGKSFFDYLLLLENNLSNIPTLLLFVLLFVAFTFLNAVTPAYVPPVDEEIDETKIVPPENMWRCMGCGEFVSLEKDRCDCGYKRD